MATWKDLHGERTLFAIRQDVRHPFLDEANGCALYLDDMSVFVFEDHGAGYRSSATEPLVANEALYSFGISPDYIRAPVLVRDLTPGSYADGANGIELVDRRNGKVILRLGTDNANDYYPSFVCEWSPENLAAVSP